MQRRLRNEQVPLALGGEPQARLGSVPLALSAGTRTDWGPPGGSSIEWYRSRRRRLGGPSSGAELEEGWRPRHAIA